MEDYSSNCYWFMHAWLLNTEDEFYLSRDEAFEWINWVKTLNKKLNKVQNDSSESIKDCLFEENENKFSIIEIFDWDKRSQHVAFIDCNGKFYDQDGPNWLIRSWEDIENLLHEYKELFWTAYYQIHILDEDLSTKVENFLNKLE
jgi:hypothetical protein